jgi:predicted nucleic acid-binding Zn ribbon protein
MRKASDQTIGQAFQTWLKESSMESKFKVTAILESWPILMGPMITKHTTLVEFRDGVLYVSLDSAPLRQELFQTRLEMIQLLNREAGAELVKEIVFK